MALESEVHGRIQIRVERLIVTLGLGRRPRESAVAARREPAQHCLRLFQCPRFGQPQLARKPVLEVSRRHSMRPLASSESPGIEAIPGSCSARLTHVCGCSPAG